MEGVYRADRVRPSSRQEPVSEPLLPPLILSPLHAGERELGEQLGRDVDLGTRVVLLEPLSLLFVQKRA